MNNTQRKRFNISSLLKECFLISAVAFVLALPLIGFRTLNGHEGLDWNFRWGYLLIAVTAVFIGRAILILWRQIHFSVVGEYWLKKLQSLNPKKHAPFFAISIGLLFILPFMPEVDRRIVDLATLVLIYVMLGWGLNIVVGLAGLLDLGYVAFYAVGAYTFALLGTVHDWSFWGSLPVAGAVAAMFGVLLGYPVLRLRGDYLAIVTLGFGEIIRVVLTNWVEFSGGPNGCLLYTSDAADE